MSGLSGVGPPPGFMISHEFESLIMHGFSSSTTWRDVETFRTVRKWVTRKRSVGTGRFSKSMNGLCSVGDGEGTGHPAVQSDAAYRDGSRLYGVHGVTNEIVV